MDVGSTIEELVRKRKDLNNKKFAELIGVSEPTLYKMYKSEDGDRISVAVAKKICKVLNVSNEFLFGDEGESEVGKSNTVSGTGNVVGSEIKNRQSFGGSDDEDCPKALDALRREFVLLQQLVQAKDEMIAVLRGR